MKRKKNIIILSSCLFIVLFKNDVLAAPLKKLYEDDSHITSFKLKENKDALEVQAESLDFGTSEVTDEDIKKRAEDDMSIVVRDNRGTREGWSLKLKFDEFQDNNKKIQGAQLFFPEVKPTTITGGPAITNPPISASSDSSFVGTNQGKLITVNGSNNTLATANKGTGFGEWLFEYKDADRVQLRLPANQRAGNYVAELTYSFESVP